MQLLLWGENLWIKAKSIKKGFIFPLFFLIGIFVFYPSLASYFYWDDFVNLCISRYIGNPFYLFIQDHFPGGYFYRPLGFFLWWISYKLFGLNPILHNLLNFLLHVINTFLFYLLFCQLFGQGRWMFLFFSLLFLIHPVSVSTSLWLSDRFDLMATLFILLTIYFFLRFYSTQQKRYFIISIFSTFLGILSKEVAYLLPLLITLIVLTFPNLKFKNSWLQKMMLLLPYYLLSVFLIGFRFILLRGREIIFFQEGIFSSLWEGFLKWVCLMPDIYSYHLNGWDVGNFVKYFFLLWFLLFCVIMVSSLKKHKFIPWHLFLFCFGIMGISGVLMAPVVHLSPLAKPGEEFSFNLIAGGRFYYLSLIGFFILLNSLVFLTFAWIKDSRFPSISLLLFLSPFVFVSFFYFISSYSLGSQWERLTNGKERQLIEQAYQTVHHSPKVHPGVKVYFLDTQKQSSYFREFGDSLLKAIAPHDSKVLHCLFFTEKPPWYNFVLKEDIQKIKIEPLLKMRSRGKEFSPLSVGGFSYFYFIFPDPEEIVKDEKAIYFEFLTHENRFIDVTAKVRLGIKKVRFFNDRPETSPSF